MSSLLGRPRPALRLSLGSAVLLMLTACGNAADQGLADPASVAEPSTESVPSTDAPPPSPPSSSQWESSAAEEPHLIVYAGGESPGVEVRKRADAKNLHGAPPSFKRFVGTLAEQLAEESTCADAYVGVVVQAVRTDGYAVGGVNDCGGYRALWVVVDGKWREVLGTQDAWDCKVLQRYRVPSEVVDGSCYDYDADQQS